MNNAKIIQKRNDNDGRQVTIEIELNSAMYQIVNVYAPNHPEERRKFFEKLNKTIENDTVNREINILLGGDFNCVLDNTKDRTNQTKSNDTGQKELINILKNHNLEDIWRRQHPEKREYTWYGGANRINKSRIDYWMTNKSNNSNITDVKIIEAPFSDHCIVESTLITKMAERGPGVWIMNTEVLKEPLFDKCFRKVWDHAIQTKPQYTDKQIWWDTTKQNIKELAMWISREKNKQKKQDIEHLETEVAKHKDKIGEEDIAAQLKEKLKQLYDDKYKGEKIRARAQWWEEGEKSSGYFFNLEKCKAQNKNWVEIFNKEGQIVDGLTNIQRVQR